MSMRRRGQHGHHDAKTISSIDDLQYLDAKHLVRDGPNQSQSNSKAQQELLTWALDAMVYGLMVFHILVAPYTKVEESFNLQATHDILHFGFQSPGALLDRSVVNKFDHLEFPGVVPRTFVGPLVLAMGSWPFLKLADLVSPVAAGEAFSKGFRAQIIVRLVLGVYTCFSWQVLRKAVQRQFGTRAAQLFMLVSACQFHWLFYAGRTLPNIFALGLVNIAYSYWLRASTPEQEEESSMTPTSPSSPPLSANGNGYMNGFGAHANDTRAMNGSGVVRALTRQDIETRLRRMMDWMIVAAVLFRSELVLLLGPILLVELITTRISFSAMVLEGLRAGLISLAAGLAIDSWFWQQPWMWAEGHVFWFNAVQGQSVAWGTSPWYTYATSLLPKILQLALPLGLLAFAVEPRYRRCLVPTLIFVGAYSCLGHKEWRFVVYVVPIFNLGAALFMDWAWKQHHYKQQQQHPLKKEQRSRDHLRSSQQTQGLVWATRWLCFLALGASLGASVLMSVISSTNYPGGQALARLHHMVGHDDGVRVHVHIDGAAAETGCSRFGELYGSQGWVYSKREDLVHPQDYVDAGFTHLLTAKPEFHQAQFEVAETVQGYAGLKRQWAGASKDWTGVCLEEVTSMWGSSEKTGRWAEKAVGLLNACSPVGIRMEDRIWIMQRRQGRLEDGREEHPYQDN